jgi:hypothetical protein
MPVTTSIRKPAKRTALVAIACFTVIALAPLLADPIFADRAFDGVGQDIGVAKGVTDSLALASPERDRAGWTRLSDYRLPGTKAKRARKK